MKELVKNKVNELINIYKNPPFNWQILELGIYKYNGKINIYINYAGQGINSIIYNGLEGIKIDLTEYIELFVNGEINFDSIIEKCIEEMEE